MPGPLPRIVVVLGPTASGKSALAIDLARRFNGEVVSADSRQVYRGLDIGSGKVTKREMRGVRHHLLDVASPRRRFTAEEYRKKARHAVNEILGRGKLPIVCGGTGLYIDALLYNNPFPAAKPNPTLRKKLEKKNIVALFTELQRKDPHRASSIDRHNKRRLMRALEIIDATGRPVPRLSKPAPLYNTLVLGMRTSDEILGANIRKRLLGWMRQGLVKEVAQLRKKGISWKRVEEFGLEYRSVAKYLQRNISRKEMLEESEREINRYAKRQMTWFKRDKNIVWLEKPAQAATRVEKFVA